MKQFLTWGAVALLYVCGASAMYLFWATIGQVVIRSLGNMIS